ncbi:MAG TPA: Gfo/Idh/MocA family oxidoreductase, partial [Planctomycetota bacterium]|nr:Gfo/Idh/MocA family oxidoreductase [Planctomycetota bacterium]
MPRSIHRRRFLRGLGASALATGLARSGHAYPANDEIRIGLIGTGGRMLHALLPSLREIGGVRIIAACDVWDRHLDEAMKRADPGAFATKDFRAILDRRDIDAVVIASPDHWHVPMTVAACEAGKDVYVEKPLTHD